MSTLFNDKDVFQKERPLQPTEQQLQKFYSEQAKEIIKQGFSDSDEESIIEDLKGLWPFNGNGFEMAKDLERGDAYYQIDVSFCEFLDSISYDFDAINRENEKAWVKAHDIKPAFPKGSKLLVKENICRGINAGMTVYVNGGSMDEGKYWIDENSERKGGTVLTFERVEKCCVLA